MKYRVDLANLETDKQDILEFWRADFPAWRSEKYEMFYENNPDGQAACFVARDERRELIGAIALFPRKMWVNGRIVSTAVAGDLAIRKDHRGTGLAQRLRGVMLDYIHASGLEYTYGTANVISKKVLEKGEWQSIGETVRMVKVLRTEKYIRRFLPVAPIARMVSWPLNWALKRRNRKLEQSLDDVYLGVAQKRFDQRFDGLWEEAKSVYGIVGERSSRFLNWRFADHPCKKFEVFTLIRRMDERLMGYVVYQLSPEGAHIEDLFASEPDRMFRILLATFVQFQRQQRADAVTFYYLGEQRVIRLFEQFGFVRRREMRTMVIQIADDNPIRAEVLNPRRWHFLYADNDVDA